MREVLGDAVFLGDVLATGGLDDRLTRGRVLQRAQELMADAVHAEQTFFSTCGSSLSVKAAMLSVAGPHEKLLIGRDAHKSVVSGLILVRDRAGVGGAAVGRRPPSRAPAVGRRLRPGLRGPSGRPRRAGDQPDTVRRHRGTCGRSPTCATGAPGR